MGTLQNSAGETKKSQNVFHEETARKNEHMEQIPAGKKENLQPDIKKEYELLERYVRNFSGSSF